MGYPYFWKHPYDLKHEWIRQKMVHLWTSPTCHQEGMIPYPTTIRTLMETWTHPLVRQRVFFRSLDFLKPPKNLPCKPKIPKNYWLLQIEHLKKTMGEHWNFEESGAKRIQQNEKKDLTQIFGRNISNNLKKLKNIHWKNMVNIENSRESGECSFLPPPKKWSKKRKFTNSTSFKSIPRPDPLEQPVVIITGNTEVRAVRSRNSEIFWRFFGAPGRTWGEDVTATWKT